MAVIIRNIYKSSDFMAISYDAIPSDFMAISYDAIPSDFRAISYGAIQSDFMAGFYDSIQSDFRAGSYDAIQSDFRAGSFDLRFPANQQEPSLQERIQERKMKKIFHKIKEFAIKHPIIFQLLLCIGGSCMVSIPYMAVAAMEGLEYDAGIVDILSEFVEGVLLVTLVVGILSYPIIVTVYEIISLFVTLKKGNMAGEGDGYTMGKSIAIMLYDIFILLVGVFFENLLLESFHSVVFTAQWYETLVNSELHSPTSSLYEMTFVVISSLYVLGMLVMTLTKKRPPLVTVLCISAMYLGVIEAVAYTIQIFGMHTLKENGEIVSRFGLDLGYTLLVPLNMILIMLKVMASEIKAYKRDENRDSKIKSKIIADIIWFIMKPLEWIFLIVIYLTDVNPEDRIARQYL